MREARALAAGLALVVTLVVPGGGSCPPVEVPRNPAESTLAQTRWLRKNLAKSEVRFHCGEPDRVDNYGLLAFWRYPGGRTIIFDASGRVTGWENFPGAATTRE